MSQVAVTVDPACGADLRLVRAWCLACDAQAEEFCNLWNIQYTPVNFFSTDVLSKLEGDDLDRFVTNSRLLTIQPSLDVQGALGFHDDIAGVIFARVMFQDDATSVTMSHEVLEELLDPTCDLYVPLGDGTSQAKEACDRVEGDTYTEPTDVGGGDIVNVQLSNYLLPAAFARNSAGPWDLMGRLMSWDGMTTGGYNILQLADGSTTEVFARTEQGRIHAAQKRQKVGGRAWRRLNP